MDLPEEMCEESYGAAVNSVLAYLIGWSPKLAAEYGVRCNGVFERCGSLLLSRYESAFGLTANGVYGLQARAHMRGRGFDFEEATRSTGGVTVFIQSDGTRITWSPEIGAALVLVGDFSRSMANCRDY